MILGVGDWGLFNLEKLSLEQGKGSLATGSGMKTSSWAWHAAACALSFALERLFRDDEN